MVQLPKFNTENKDTTQWLFNSIFSTSYSKLDFWTGIFDYGSLCYKPEIQLSISFLLCAENWILLATNYSYSWMEFLQFFPLQKKFLLCFSFFFAFCCFKDTDFFYHRTWIFLWCVNAVYKSNIPILGWKWYTHPPRTSNKN